VDVKPKGVKGEPGFSKKHRERKGGGGGWKGHIGAKKYREGGAPVATKKNRVV